MILAGLAPLTGLLLGYGLLRLARTSWPHLALLAAGQLVGMPLATLMWFALLQLGVPSGPGLAYTLLALGVFLTGASLRRPLAEPVRWSRDALPLLLALGHAGLVLLQYLNAPSPVGDGIGNFGMKARFFYEEGTVWTFLKDARLHALHLDYPLHVPLGMNLGYAFAGTTSGAAALASDLPVMPAITLFLGVMLARRTRLGAPLAAFAFLAAPVVHRYATSGYADPPMAALFLVAGVALAERRPTWFVAGLATGLLPWVKLEGIFLGGLVGLAGILLVVRTRRLPFTFFLPAMALGAVWPLTLILQDLVQPVAEKVAEATAGERFEALVHGFGRLIVNPCEVFGFALAPALLAVPFALRRPGMRVAAGLGLAVILLYPAVTWLRNTALIHLSGGVPIRLYLQGFPLLLYVLGSELTWPRIGSAPAPRAVE